MRVASALHTAADFSSALYLGLKHGSADLPRWTDLTRGRPIVLDDDPLDRRVAARAAELQGCEAGLVWPSTLHAVIDLLDVLSRSHMLIASRNLYPIMGWALERIMGQGRSVRFVGDRQDVLSAIYTCPSGLRPALLVPAHDSRGQPLLWTDELKALDQRNGLLITDHTQLFGLWGCRKFPMANGWHGAENPWGLGGGGWLAFSGHIQAGLSRRVVLVASWAKAFGASIATVCGPSEVLEAFEGWGGTRVHCSPANRVALLSALHAIRANERSGEYLRKKLRGNVRLLQRLLQSAWRLSNLGKTKINDLAWKPGLHPMIRQDALGVAQAQDLQRRFGRLGVRCVAVPGSGVGQAALVWLVRADHGARDFEVLQRALNCLRLTSTTRSLRDQSAPLSNLEFEGAYV